MIFSLMPHDLQIQKNQPFFNNLIQIFCGIVVKIMFKPTSEIDFSAKTKMVILILLQWLYVIDQQSAVQIIPMNLLLVAFAGLLVLSLGAQYMVVTRDRPNEPILSHLNQHNSVYRQVFNPTWIDYSPAVKRSGLVVQTQDCDYVNKCNYCKGTGKQVSFLTVSKYLFPPSVYVIWSPITKDNITFASQQFYQQYGVGDPRLSYNKADNIYYMFYTAKNVFPDSVLYLATTPNPYNQSAWKKHGPVFQGSPKAMAGAVLIRETGPHYLYWGDKEIRVSKSENLTNWQDIGEVLISPRPQKFDAKFVQVGPSPLRLTNGNYILFYNSADMSWPEDQAASSYPGWVILDGDDPTKVVERSEKPFMYPVHDFEKGLPPYSCNRPNIITLVSAWQSGTNQFLVYYSGADAAIGQVEIGVDIPESSLQKQ